MARPSNTADRRARIAGALLQVMAKRGYDGASVTDIAQAAQLTPGLVHYHFKNKHEILLTLLDELSVRHFAGLDARLAAVGTDASYRLDAFIDFHLGLGASADPEALNCWILLSGEALRDKQVQVAYEQTLAGLHARLVTIVQSGVDEGRFSADDPDAAASALLATIQGYFVLAATARALIPRGTAAAATKRMARGLLTGPRHEERAAAARPARKDDA